MTEANCQIYIGAPIDQASERSFLASMAAQMEVLKIPSIILANVHIGGRQIDFILATACRADLIEVKSTILPVRGGINGAWERKDASGTWRTYTNAYQQAWNAKCALRDEMNSTKSVGKYYPSGHVVFTKNLPAGSALTPGDTKVAMSLLPEFLSRLDRVDNSPWQLVDWELLANKMSLIQVSLEEAIASDEVRRFYDLLHQYNAAVIEQYSPDADRWIPEDVNQRDVCIAAATSGAGCYIDGPSGCGKSLLAKFLAVHFARQGISALFFAAKDFAGSWNEFISREVALLIDKRPSALHHAISFTGNPVFLVFDGINELGRHRTAALRGIRALARRLRAKLIVIGQERDPPELVGLEHLSISAPTVDLKCRIAQRDGATLGAATLEVLRAVRSGFEADIVRQIGADVSPGSTRVTLIDQYVRVRLGPYAREAAFGLRRLASILYEHTSFSMSETAFDELMRSEKLGFSTAGALFDTAILIRRANRISFSHELIQNAYAALVIAQRATEDPAALGHELSLPKLESMALDIASAIEDVSVCRRVLAHCANASVLSKAANGELGPIAREVARALLEDAHMTCAADISDAELLLTTEKDVTSVSWGEHGAKTWSPTMRARLNAIGSRAALGTSIDPYLDLCAKMDRQLALERRRLAEAARALKFPLRSRSFELVYLHSSGRLGFDFVARAARATWLHRDRRGGEFKSRLSSLSSGQLYFVLEHRHLLSNASKDEFADDLALLLRDRFNHEPYHVQLAILNSAAFVRDVSEESKERLIEAIQSLDVDAGNWAINSCIIDSLKFLGALEEDGNNAREQIRAEIEAAVADDDQMMGRGRLALSVYERTFDHPFDAVYAEEVFDLPESARRRLYRRALSACASTSFSLQWLCGEVASFDDPSDAILFQRFVTLPDPSNAFPQAQWGAFVSATRFLARHGRPLPLRQGVLPEEQCVENIRALVYGAERQPITSEEVAAAWQDLRATSAQLVMGCLSEVQQALLDRSNSDSKTSALYLPEIYAAQCIEIARRFIRDGAPAQYFHKVPMREIGPLLAFDIVGRYGDRGDIAMLQEIHVTHPYARYALEAIKSIDTVSVSRE